MTDDTNDTDARADAGTRNDPEAVKYVNCAACRCELLGRSRGNLLLAGRVFRVMPPVLAGRVANRPYCRACLDKCLKELRGEKS